MTYIIIIFLIFAIIHSITVSAKFKHLCRSILGDTFMRVFYRALYNAISLITALIALYFIAKIPDREIWFAPLWLRWPMHAVQIAVLIFGARAFEYLDTWEFMGVTQMWRYLTKREVSGNIEGLTQKELVTDGVYGVVRHPMYLAGLVMVTCNPYLSVNSLTLMALADLYFLFGAYIEERRFLKIFGDEYRRYMERVPRLIPRIFQRRGDRH